MNTDYESDGLMMGKTEEEILSNCRDKEKSRIKIRLYQLLRNTRYLNEYYEPRVRSIEKLFSFQEQPISAYESCAMKQEVVDAIIEMNDQNSSAIKDK